MRVSGSSQTCWVGTAYCGLNAVLHRKGEPKSAAIQSQTNVATFQRSERSPMTPGQSANSLSSTHTYSKQQKCLTKANLRGEEENEVLGHRYGYKVHEKSKFRESVFRSQDEFEVHVWC